MFKKSVNVNRSRDHNKTVLFILTYDIFVTIMNIRTWTICVYFYNK